MILNSEEAKSLESLLADKGIINAVRCSVCHNLTAFEDEDIVWAPQIVFMGNRDVEMWRRGIFVVLGVRIVCMSRKGSKVRLG